MFTGKTIVIFSPQRWNEIFISKHHYAMTLARTNNVWFVSAPADNMGVGYSVHSISTSPNLKLLEYHVMLPNVVKFRLPGLYKNAVTSAIKKLLMKICGPIDICIDFGCYQLFDSLDFIEAEQKVYFPVDDFSHLKLSNRGAGHIFSVSLNIVEKLNARGLKCIFINHGLAESFAEKARARLQFDALRYQPSHPVKIGYSGNLFIRFVDIPVFKRIISSNPDVEFHFFGAVKFDKANSTHSNWADFLQNTPNVVLHGFKRPEDLSEAYQALDGFILCYKPDYMDYHGENSHKVFEYLSTGKVMISTHLSIYENSSVICMSPKDQNEMLPEIFDRVVKSLPEYNSSELQLKRINLALDNTYEKQLERIADFAGLENAVI